MTSKERNDTIMDKFKRIGRRRFTDGIDPPGIRKEYTVTITNHVRMIQNLADEVIQHVDGRAYGAAHCFLDDIEKKVREAHRHIDHLQNVTDFCARPAGED